LNAAFYKYASQDSQPILFDCSNAVQVPLDYSAEKGNASIALVRLPSTAPKSEYLGPILFNPGGPGGSGVTTIVSMGAQAAELLGNQFDIVGFGASCRIAFQVR
jgi:hypothetical protein